MSVSGGVEAAGAVEIADAHMREQRALVDATLAAVVGLWARMDPRAWFDSWWRQRIGQQIYVLVSLAQESVASEAHPYVDAVLSILGAPADIPALVPATFAGIASDGTDLEALLSLAPVISYARTERGWDAARAAAAGDVFLRQVVTTQIQDAGRAADQVALSVATPVIPTQRRGSAPIVPVDVSVPRDQQVQPRPQGFRPRGRRSTYNFKQEYGYIRVLTPPSCVRCIVLAGKFYRWNEGFPRHPMCDCRHLPAPAVDGDQFVTDPQAYFDSLSRSQQDDAFGRANAEAIRGGADISRVVNATRTGSTWTADNGRRYTRAGTASSRRRRNGPVGPVLRPTPWQIFKDARGNRDEATRLLHEFGYILR